MDENTRDIIAQSVARRTIELASINAYMEVAQGRAESFQPSDIQRLHFRSDEIELELGEMGASILIQYGAEGLQEVWTRANEFMNVGVS